MNYLHIYIYKTNILYNISFFLIYFHFYSSLIANPDIEIPNEITQLSNLKDLYV